MTPPPIAPSTPRRPIGLIVLVLVLALLLVGRLALAGVVRFLGPGPKTLANAPGRWPSGDTGEAVAAARQCVVDFLSISEGTVARDIRKVLDCATGTFAREYEDGREDLERAIQENDVQSHGKALSAAVVTADSKNVTVLVAADANVKNTSGPQGRKVHYRVQVEMSLDAGRWKIAELRFVG